MKYFSLIKGRSVASLIFFIFIWQIVGMMSLVNPTLFPPPTKVVYSFFDLLMGGELFLHINSSMRRMILGLVIGSLSGVIVGMLTGRLDFFDEMLSPLFNALRPIPPVAMIPLIIVWMGIGEQAKVFSISFATFFPVWINSHIGASRVQDQYLKAASLLTNSCIKKWLQVILPAALPFISAGIRIGISIAFIMVFVSELAGSSSGIGYLISVSHLSYRIDKMIVGLILLGVFGFLTDSAFSKGIRRIFPWLENI